MGLGSRQTGGKADRREDGQEGRRTGGKADRKMDRREDRHEGRRTGRRTGRTRFVALRGQIGAAECLAVASDRHCQHVYRAVLVLHLPVSNRTRTRLVWLQRCQWYKKYWIEKYSIKFLTITVTLNTAI